MTRRPAVVTDVEVLTASELQAPPDAVWARVASMKGINHELGPWMRMTAPRGAELSPEAVPLGRRWFRSWILLLGVLPFDYDHLRLIAIEPGRGFHEDSTMLSQRRWVHRRTLEPTDGGTRVVDRIEFEPRLPGLAGFLRPIFRAVFRHRHRRLAAHFRRGG